MPTARRRRALVAVMALGLLPLACSDDGGSTAEPTTTTTTTVDADGTSTTVDAALLPLLLTADDLPPGFELAAAGADTVTSFCVGQDATAGLQAVDRGLVTFRRTPEGAAVVQLVFRFEGTDASAFVAQATRLFESCAEVPDAQGLAFTYEPAAPEVEAALAGTTSHVVRNGTSIGSGSLTSTTAVFQVGDDLAELVGVLGVDQPRAELDHLAATAIGAAVEKAG